MYTKKFIMHAYTYTDIADEILYTYTAYIYVAILSCCRVYNALCLTI